jgi:hypothetical protein
MNMDEGLKAKFNKFVGREVPVAEAQKTCTSRRTGESFPYTVCTLDETSPVMKELREAVAASGLNLRVWLPGTMGTMDYRTDRLNVHIGKEADGKYRIAPNIAIG